MVLRKDGGGQFVLSSEIPYLAAQMIPASRVQANQPHFIVNPASSAGSTGRSLEILLKQLNERFPDGFTMEITGGNGHATDMTRKALLAGSDLVVAVGGDGTIHEVVNGFFDSSGPIQSKARLGLVCSGTAQDVARNLGLSVKITDQLDAIVGVGSRTIDLGKVRYRGRDGAEATRLFINECQAGIAAEVVKKVSPALKRLGGFLAFGVTSTLVAATYRGRELSVRLDGSRIISGSFLGMAVANGRYAGGGMDFAPESSIDDGLLDVIMIRDQAVPARLWNLPKIYSGRHINLPWISSARARRVEITSPDQVSLEADGELLGFLPCEVEVIPRALCIKAPLMTDRGPESA